MKPHAHAELHPLVGQLLRESGATPDAPPSPEMWRDLLQRVSGTYHEADQQRSATETELEAQRQQLQESYARMLATLESATEGIMVVDTRREVIAINKQFARVMNIPVEVLETQDYKLITRHALQSYRDPVAAIARINAIHATQDSFRDEIVLADGRLIDRYSAPVRLPDKRGVGRVTFFRDVTPERMAHRELERAREDAEAASHAKSMFLASMSHELRTPLNAVIGLADLLLLDDGDPVTAQQRAYLEGITQSGRHLLSLVNDVLDLAKIEAGKHELEIERVPPLEAVSEAVSAMQPLAHHRGVKLAIDMPDDLPVMSADRLRLRQVLINLMSNAVKFTNPGGDVRLRGWREDGAIAIAVADTGIGIAPKDLTRLFRAFEQLSQPSGDRPAGTGLGLALSQRLVAMHRGSIDVESSLGVGTTFTIRIPTHLEGLNGASADR